MTLASPTIPLHLLRTIFLREIGTLEAMIEAYPSDASLWVLAPGIANSGGTLALHLCGNLQHYVGAHLGDSGYVRDRTAEFGTRDVSRAQVVQTIRTTRRVVAETLHHVTSAQLQAEFPETVGGVTLVTAPFLVHLLSHFAYHLGQIDFHRRMTTEGSALPGTLSLPPLTRGLD